MAVKTLPQIQTDLGNERSGRGSRLSKTAGVSIFTLLRDLIDSYESITNTLIDDNVSVQEILAETEVIGVHHHSFERWMEMAAVAVGETHVADMIGTVAGNGPFIMDAGNLTWGAWIQILGSSDTPVQAGKTFFDLHKIIVEATELNESYYIHIAYGASGAVAYAAGDYSESVLQPISNQVDSAPLEIQTERFASGTKVWARCMCPGQNTATINFYPGLHEYNE